MLGAGYKTKKELKESVVKTFKVTWEIEISSENAEDAAREALNIQQDRESTASVFEVTDMENGKIETVDIELIDSYI